MKPKPKKNRSAHSGKVIVPAIPLDLTGRPIFPLTLGDLTLHSIGEVSVIRVAAVDMRFLCIRITHLCNYFVWLSE